ncbi:MAG: HD domain-containing protein [Fimbriimonadaceae bacterium]|nr:bifunctional (p)ppGpp synthetase/guanosine-3',5'-bis(diphosphate) 3'-pyrophosphohydrolase [Chthonomonadaceae bacterium]MCO5297365.1 HD domain-containing protein [Fimbriimonadaceae bacterium]
MTSGARCLESAILWAVEVHAGEVRDGPCPTPYVAHPLEVLCLVRYAGGVTNEAMLCAAVLHDVVESGKVTLEEVEARFGPRTRGLVGELTRTEPNEDAVAGLTADEIWTLRADLLAEDVAHMSPEAQAIKLADRISNLAMALATKKGAKLKRHLKQTHRLMKLIPKEANPNLRALLKARLAGAERELSRLRTQESPPAPAEP